MRTQMNQQPMSLNSYFKQTLSISIASESTRTSTTLFPGIEDTYITGHVVWWDHPLLGHVWYPWRWQRRVRFVGDGKYIVT